MKTNLFATIIGCVMTVSTACPTMAADYRHHVNHRQHRQQYRLNQGLSSGSLTGREYRRIERRESDLAVQEARMRRSGAGLSPAEACKLNREQNRLSHNIYRQKHDGQFR